MSDTDDAAQRSLRLQRINQKGLEVATKLAGLKAGQNITLADMGTGLERAGLTKEERLRNYLDLINASRTRLLSGPGGGYGRCLACGVELTPAALDELPWTERCGDCERDKAPLA